MPHLETTTFMHTITMFWFTLMLLMLLNTKLLQKITKQEQAKKQ